MSTPLRAIRVPDGLWHAAQQRATARGESVTAVIVRALEEYALANAKQDCGSEDRP